MKLGIIGAGAIVETFLSFIHEIDDIELKAICATPTEDEKLKKICEKHNIPVYYTDVDKMLGNKEVEVIYVAAPNHLHYLFTKKSLEAGKHVICEKPFTSNADESKELSDLARKLSLILLEAVNTRYLPNALKIKEELNKLGDIKIVSMNYSQYSSRYDAFKAGKVLPAFDPKMSGGALMDLNIYNINFAVMLFGAPVNIDYQANIEREIDTSGILTLDYDSFKCVCIAAKDCKAPMTTTIQGDEGCILITSSLNLLEEYRILMNKESSGTQMSGDGGILHNYNNGKFRMYHEFMAFAEIIKNKDYKKADEMLEVTRITMDIQTEARKKAGVMFAADNNKGGNVK